MDNISPDRGGCVSGNVYGFDRLAHCEAQGMTYKRRDNNHNEIRNDLTKAGYWNYDTADLGKGFPDVLALRKDRSVVLLEIKSPGEHLTPAETKFHLWYPGEIAIVYSTEDALKALATVERMIQG